MKGNIVSSSYGTYSVMADGVIYHVIARGVFRNKNIKPVVGDEVEIDEENCIITMIYPRKTYLKRPVIANADTLLIIQSLFKPDFSYLLTFKYLTYAKMNGLKPYVIITKQDQTHDANTEQEIINTFNSVGVETYFVSNKTGYGLENIKKLFEGHITCLIGQTGVGKSSLINSIDPSFSRSIGEYSKALGRGKHKTKEIILLPYQNGYIADTPGFSSLDLSIYKEDLAMFFPGFDSYNDCYFSDCLHISEDKCVIKKLVNEGKISPIAYNNYLKLSNETDFKNKRYFK